VKLFKLWLHCIINNLMLHWDQDHRMCRSIEAYPAKPKRYCTCGWKP
jgi:hypothetical protein